MFIFIDPIHFKIKFSATPRKFSVPLLFFTLIYFETLRYLNGVNSSKITKNYLSLFTEKNDFILLPYQCYMIFSYELKYYHKTWIKK